MMTLKINGGIYGGGRSCLSELSVRAASILIPLERGPFVPLGGED